MTDYDQQVSDLMAKTYTSSRESIEGHYYYDSVKRQWLKIIEAEKVFVSFDYAFGCRWATHHHVIRRARRASAAMVNKIMTCPDSEFGKLRA